MLERIPVLGPEESEMLGILFGDGSMSKTKSSVQISIAGHIREDREYLTNHVRPIFAFLFGKSLSMIVQPNYNAMRLYTYSKVIAETLYDWGMPFGKKKLSSLTPTTKLDESSFVRGLFDTDGSVFRKYEKYLQIQFKSVNPSLLIFLRKGLASLGFHPTSIGRDDTKFRVYLSRQAEIDRFIRVIRPANPKHLRRFGKFRSGKVFRPYTHGAETSQSTQKTTKAFRNNFVAEQPWGHEAFGESRGAVV